MKKLLALALSIMLVCSFCACSKNKEQEKTSLPTHGTIDGSTYTNSFANITFTLPQGWVFMSDSELLETTDDTDSEITDEKIQSDFYDYGLAYDMTAYSENLRTSVGLIFANTEHEELKGLSVKDVLYEMITQIGLDESGGITEETVTICGNSYTRFCLTTKTGTGDTGYATFYGRQKGSAVVMIVAACTDAFTVADCESCFS